MYVAFSQLLYLWDLEEQRGRGFNVIIRREGEKPQKDEILWGAIKNLPTELTTELLCLESPIYFSLLWCENIYALPT